MAGRYNDAGHPAAADYASWAPFAIRPYLSRAHTNRYVVNYANAIAAEHYARFEAIDEMPVGAILAKDSFAVTQRGRVVIGALSIMEKMPDGFNPDYGDWRFSLVLPDGRLFGSTNGTDASSVEFCQRCHRDAGPEQDYLYFLPRRFRVTER